MTVRQLWTVTEACLFERAGLGEGEVACGVMTHVYMVMRALAWSFSLSCVVDV